MRVQYTESFIAANPTRKEVLLRNLWGVLLALSCILAIFASMIFFIPALVFGSLLYRSMIVTSAEYEYIHTNDDFDIDRVAFNSKRKRVISIRVEEILCIAPYHSSRAEQYVCRSENDYSANAEGENLYVIVYQRSGDLHRVLLNLDRKMLNSLRMWIPGKVEILR